MAARMIERPGMWLNDEHIDHAQHLLGKGFTSISGFQSTVVFESTQIKCPKSKFIQILNVYNNHWVTVSNVDCKNANEIKIYDSMKSSRLETSDKFNCQVAALMNCSSSKINVQYANVKQQVGGSDCGLFAIAFATSLCFGLSPEKQNYNQKEMRSHLSKCFLEGKIDPFPVALPNIVPAPNTGYNIALCFKCRKPQSALNNMNQCMLCTHKFHSHCDNSPSVLFVCFACKEEAYLL